MSITDVQVRRIAPDSPLWDGLAAFAEGCSWIAGKHLAGMMRTYAFEPWEAVFAATCGTEFAGFCTLLRTDYYPENRYFPWISTVFVAEPFRGRRLSGALIAAAEAHARSCGFTRVYIPSDMTGFYERFGYVRIDRLVNYGGDTDNIFEKRLAP